MPRYIAIQAYRFPIWGPLSSVLLSSSSLSTKVLGNLPFKIFHLGEDVFYRIRRLLRLGRWHQFLKLITQLINFICEPWLDYTVDVHGLLVARVNVTTHAKVFGGLLLTYSTNNGILEIVRSLTYELPRYVVINDPID